ncbi:putative plastidic glucose transporter [Arachis hypogaea]|nr:putative plastidic glucose transporter [Arachis hypogaea]
MLVNSPGIPLTLVTLGLNNCHVWGKAMWRALKSRNKIKFVDDSIKRPALNDSLFDAWERFDLWCDLKHRFYQGDIFRIAELEEELFAVKQGDFSVTVYFTKLKGICEELETIITNPLDNPDNQLLLEGEAEAEEEEDLVAEVEAYKVVHFLWFVLTFAVGAGPVPGLLLSEVLPSKIRALLD